MNAHVRILFLLLGVLTGVTLSKGQELVEFKLTGNTNERIKAGDVVNLRLSAVARGPGELSLTIDEPMPAFIPSWRDTAIQCDSECEFTTTLTLEPKANDCGRVDFAVRAKLRSDSGEDIRSQPVTVEVFPKMKPVPAFTSGSQTELCWDGCIALDQEIEVTEFDEDSEVVDQRLGSATAKATCRIADEQRHGMTYRYVVQTTGFDENGNTVLFESEPEFSRHDSREPDSVRVRSFFTAPNLDVRLDWDNVDDTGSFVDKYQIIREVDWPPAGDVGIARVEIVGVQPFYPITDIDPPNYYPVVARDNVSLYSDAESVRIVDIPRQVRGSVMIRTAFRDRWNESKEFLKFWLGEPATIYVAYDRNSTTPEWLESFNKLSDVKLRTTTHPNGKLQLWYAKYASGDTVKLGGNFASGSELKRSTVMYVAFVQPDEPDKVPYSSDGPLGFTDTLSNLNLQQRLRFKYIIDTFDAAGNIAHGPPSRPVAIDPKGECRPEIVAWSDTVVNEQHFSRGNSNEICIKEPALDSDCESFRRTDSLRFQAVRDSLKLFELSDFNDTTFFDSGWIGRDQLRPAADTALCFTFDLLPAGHGPQFVDGHIYHYRVMAKDKNGNLSAWSDTVAARQDNRPPGAIDNFNVASDVRNACRDAVMELNWDAASDRGGSGVAGCTIYRRVVGLDDDFIPFDTVGANVTTYIDVLDELSESRQVLYKVGCFDTFGQEFDVTGMQSKGGQALIAPPLSRLTPESPSCAPGFAAIDADTVHYTLLDTLPRPPEIEGFEVTVEGPGCSYLVPFISGAQDTFAIPLTCGDGEYVIKLRADFAGTLSRCSVDSLLKQTMSPPPIDTLVVQRDTKPTGNIFLSWQHASPNVVKEYAVFVWPVGEERPAEPDTVTQTTSWTFTEDIPVYQCFNFSVEARDCFGRPSIDEPIVKQYSNKPPEFDPVRFDTGAANIVVCWDRPAPLFEGAQNVNTIVKIYQDSITAEPHKIDSVFNKTCIDVALDPMHVYIFFIKEKITDALAPCDNGMLMSAWSKPVSVPLDAAVPQVDFEVQPLPVPPDSITGSVFLSWRGYFETHAERIDRDRIDRFVVQWQAESGSDSMLVAVADFFDNLSLQGADTLDVVETALVASLDPEPDYVFTVIAIDTLDQRSPPKYKPASFKPRWVFTPAITGLNPDCFRDSVTAILGWLDDAGQPADSMFGADSVQFQVDIDSGFVSPRATTTAWLAKDLVSHEFIKEQDYPTASRSNESVFFRIRAKDRFGHVSPWSSEYDELHTGPGRYDEREPGQVVCEIDSIIAPDSGLANAVDVFLSWPPATDSCGIKDYLMVIHNGSEADTIRVADINHADKGVSATILGGRKWQVHPVDLVGNVQTRADTCRFQHMILPPDSSWLEVTLLPDDSIDSVLTWEPGATNFPNSTLSYLVELSNNPDFFGKKDINPAFSECSNFQDSLSYAFSRFKNVDRIFWRIKARVAGRFESAWSKTFSAARDSSGPPVHVAHDVDTVVPEAYNLRQNYPNPFNPFTTIVYDIPKDATNGIRVHLDVFNVVGQKIRTLVRENKYPGRYEVVWDGQSDNGAMSGSGIYYYRMRAGDFITTRKLVLLK